VNRWSDATTTVAQSSSSEACAGEASELEWIVMIRGSGFGKISRESGAQTRTTHPKNSAHSA
jgi:hypothetical protein